MAEALLAAEGWSEAPRQAKAQPKRSISPSGSRPLASWPRILKSPTAGHVAPLPSVPPLRASELPAPAAPHLDTAAAVPGRQGWSKVSETGFSSSVPRARRFHSPFPAQVGSYGLVDSGSR